MRSRLYFGLVISVLSLTMACATAAEIPNAPGDGGTVGADTAKADTGATAADTATTTDSAPATDSATTADTSTTGPCGLVINELLTGTTASGDEEFVEIYNSCATESPALTGWYIGYRGGSATIDTRVYEFADGVTIAPKSYFVIGQVPEAGSEQMFSGTGFGKDGAVVILRSDTDAAIDALGYGNTSSKVTEGTKAPAAGDGKTLARVPNGVDTDDNSADFTVGSPTPGAAN